jgi:hypothetical protein
MNTRVSKHESLFTSPPAGVPQGHDNAYGNGVSVDAPLLGNGDMTAAFAFYPGFPQFWVSTNDFWEQKTDNWIPENWSVGPGRPLPVGRLVFDMPALLDAKVTARQRFADAVTIAEYELAGQKALAMRSLVCASENILLCEFAVPPGAGDVEINALFLFPEQLGLGLDKKGDYRRFWSKAYTRNQASEYMEDAGPVMHGFRRISGNVDQETQVSFAGRFIGRDGPTIKLKAGEKAVYALVLRSEEKTILSGRHAFARAETLKAGDVRMLEELHRAWWKNFWDVSEVEIEDPLIEQRYYLSQYVIASMSRDPKFPPNIFGICTWDNPLWNGNYKINYNHQAPYWGLYASGHYEQADPHDAPYLALEGQGRQISEKLTGHPGVLMPGGIGPKGLVSESMIFHMKSMGAFALCNMAMRWYTSYDPAYGVKIYSYLRGIVEFWENDLQFDGTYYHVVNDHAHEMWIDVDTMDAPSTLAFIKNALRLILDISAVLDVDSEKRGKWREILEKLPPYAVKDASEITKLWGSEAKEKLRLTDVYPEEFLKGRKIFLLHGNGEEYSFNCAVFLQQVFAAGDIGPGSDPELLKIARNSVELRIAHEEHFDDWGISAIKKDGKPVFEFTGAWNDNNHSCMFFPIAVRVGYDPEKIWAALRSFYEKRGLPNGYIRNNPHGIENCSTAPNTVQEMMMLSYEGVIRLFRCWPKKAQSSVAFRNLRAYGAFRVSARLEKGAVKDVVIVSEKGRFCAVEVFSGHPVVSCHGENILFTREGDIIRFETIAGETYSVS